MGFTIGMAMNNYIPITIYPRWNFLLLSINQLINHLDKFNYMFDKKIKVIIRASIGSKHPLNPQHQHVGDFSSSIKLMSKNLDIIKLREPKDILSSYKKALHRKDGKSTILVEYGDYYNLK
jgi:pyruvate/2-oxoglutarate/acetoin dehydrogenase E1 component